MTRLYFYLPIDHHVEYHKYFGGLLFILSAIHTTAHLYNVQKNFVGDKYPSFLMANNLTMTETKNLSYTEWLFTDQPKVNGFIAGWANPTGVLLGILSLLIA